jgi:hypothetical protein
VSDQGDGGPSDSIDAIAGGIGPPYTVDFHEDAMGELLGLDTRDQEAVQHARDKLIALGDRLPFPHQSAVRRGAPLRELRPRGGRCRWRPLYARVGAGFVILAIAPEAEIDPKGFRRGVDAALQRLADLTEEGS